MPCSEAKNLINIRPWYFVISSYIFLFHERTFTNILFNLFINGRNILLLFTLSLFFFLLVLFFFYLHMIVKIIRGGDFGLPVRA